MRTVRGRRRAQLVWLVLAGLWIVPQAVLSHGLQERDLAELVDGNTAFALALYEQVGAVPGNLVFSPFSISAALAMTYGGARGDTATEMADALQFTLPEERFHRAFQSLFAELDGTDKDYELAVANSLWGQQGFEFLQTFLELSRERYGAGLQEVDFETNPEAARQEINAWVSEKTRQLIRELLGPETVDAWTRLVLVNAIYLKASWATPFDPEFTRPRDFHISAKETVEVPTMAEVARFPYAGLDELQILELPYEGRELSMVVLLPAHDLDLDVLEQQLSPRRLGEWLEALRGELVSVRLPRFSTRTGLLFRQVLGAMGMPRAFSPEADFSGMTSEEELAIDEVIHEAFIDVDEAGTEAAAATAVIMWVGAAPGLPPQPVLFHVDRPFVFLLRHRPTGTILFMGRITDPR